MDSFLSSSQRFVEQNSGCREKEKGGGQGRMDLNSPLHIQPNKHLSKEQYSMINLLVHSSWELLHCHI